MYKDMSYSTRIGIGERIKSVRLFRGMTHNELAAECRMSRKHLIAIENSTRSVGIVAIMDICKALNCSADYILFGDESVAGEEFLISDPYWSETAVLLSRLKDCRRDRINQLLTELIEIDKAMFEQAKEKCKEILADEDL